MDAHVALGHVPYRSWCAACIAGHARADAHKKREDEADVFAFDYGYLERRIDAELEEATPSPLLMGRDSRTC
eukprot:3853846-Amphidinium_carterae.2